VGFLGADTCRARSIIPLPGGEGQGRGSAAVRLRVDRRRGSTPTHPLPRGGGVSGLCRFALLFANGRDGRVVGLLGLALSRRRGRFGALPLLGLALGEIALPGLALGARPLFGRHDNDAARPLSIKAGVDLGRVPPAAIEERVCHPPVWNIKGTCRKAGIILWEQVRGSWLPCTETDSTIEAGPGRIAAMTLFSRGVVDNLVSNAIWYVGCAVLAAVGWYLAFLTPSVAKLAPLSYLFVVLLVLALAFPAAYYGVRLYRYIKPLTDMQAPPNGDGTQEISSLFESVNGLSGSVCNLAHDTGVLLAQAEAQWIEKNRVEPLVRARETIQGQMQELLLRASQPNAFARPEPGMRNGAIDYFNNVGALLGGGDLQIGFAVPDVAPVHYNPATAVRGDEAVENEEYRYKLRSFWHGGEHWLRRIAAHEAKYERRIQELRAQFEQEMIKRVTPYDQVD